MLKATKEYWSEVVVPAMKWMVRHWKGFLVFLAAIEGVTIAYISGYSIADIKKLIKENFSKTEEES